MALLVCPDCGGNVSSKAAKCPRCGCPVSVMIQEQQESVDKQEPEVKQEPIEQQKPEALPIVEAEQHTVAVQPVIQQHKSEPTKANATNAENHNPNTKWIMIALFAAAIIVAIVVFSKKSSDSDYYYDTSQNEPNYETITVNGVSFKMIKVDGGSFQMGSNDKDAWDVEKPVHSVTLSDYYIGETEVTQSLWEAVMGTNPSRYKNGGNYPVERVSYDNIVNVFLPKLNRMTGKRFSLPTEAQWEYAARGGNKSNGYKYSGSNNLDQVAWIATETPKPVKSKSPNEIGLYDMSGNILEWCSDWYDWDYYAKSPSNNPEGASSGEHRVRRGGCWRGDARGCQVCHRDFQVSAAADEYTGFRLVLH